MKRKELKSSTEWHCQLQSEVYRLGLRHGAEDNLIRQEWFMMRLTQTCVAVEKQLVL